MRLLSGSVDSLSRRMLDFFSFILSYVFRAAESIDTFGFSVGGWKNSSVFRIDQYLFLWHYLRKFGVQNRNENVKSSEEVKLERKECLLRTETKINRNEEKQK